MTKIRLFAGGSDQIDLEPNKINIPDLWHVAMRLEGRGFFGDSELVLDCWHKANALLHHIRQDQS